MKRVLIKISILLVTLVSLFSQAAGISDAPEVKIKWLGGPAMVISFNGFNILTDPTFGEGNEAFLMADPNEAFDLAKGPNVKSHQRLTPFLGIDAQVINLVILSHAHEDHFDQVAQQQLDISVPILAPTEDFEKVSQMGFSDIQGMAWGEQVEFIAGAGEITVTAINAYHANNPKMTPLLGVGNGYWIEFKQGSWKKSIYWTGDTLPTNHVIQAVKILGNPDILIPHMGRVGTTGPLGQISMGADDVIKLAAQLSPKKVLPIHHSTYSLYLEPIDKLVNQSKGETFELDVISEGSSLIYK